MYRIETTIVFKSLTAMVISLQSGVLGSGVGQFNNPGVIHVDSSGKVYLSDDGNNRIEVFSPSFIKQSTTNIKTNRVISNIKDTGLPPNGIMVGYNPNDISVNPTTNIAYVTSLMTVQSLLLMVKQIW